LDFEKWTKINVQKQKTERLLGSDFFTFCPPSLSYFGEIYISVIWLKERRGGWLARLGGQTENTMYGVEYTSRISSKILLVLFKYEENARSSKMVERIIRASARSMIALFSLI